MSVEIDWIGVVRGVVVIGLIGLAGFRFLPALLRFAFSKKEQVINKTADEVQVPQGDPAGVMLSPDGVANYLKMIESETPLASDEQRWQWAKLQLSRFETLKIYSKELERIVQSSREDQPNEKT